jgi:hypothetical protein
MARFISKSNNLLIVLKPGLPAQPLTGSPAKPTLFVRFKDGVADVPDGELTDLMMKHPGFNADYISAEIGDPYGAARTPSEPVHVITEMKYGTPVGKKVMGDKPPVSPELSRMIDERAKEMAHQMFAGLKEEFLAEIRAAQEEKAAKGETVSLPAVNTSDEKKKGGRPKKVVTDEEGNPTIITDA